MRNVFVSGQALWAMAAIIALASCRSPTTPSPTAAPPPARAQVGLASVTPATPVHSDTAQVLTIAGFNFRPGLVLKITNPIGVSVTVPSTDIQNLSPTSFQVSVILQDAGRYLIVVQQIDGETSDSFSLPVLDAPVPDPRIDDVSPSQTIVGDKAQQVSLIGANFDVSLTVHVVDPDNVVTLISAGGFTIEANSVIRFLMVVSKTGTYTFSLWNGDGLASNFGNMLVR